MDQANQNEIVIVPGADVVGSDGDKVGSVKEVFPDYMTVEKGWFFPSDHYIPATAIRDANQDTVTLNVTKDEALQQGWENPPTGATAAGAYSAGTSATGTGTMATDNTGRVMSDTTTVGDTAVGSYATGDMAATGGAGTEHGRPFEHSVDENAAHLDENQEIRVPLAEEELTATKRPVDRGAVRVTKDVEEREQTLNVPVREEHVNVERRSVDRDVAPDETAFQEGTIDVPVRGEEVQTQKRARVGEELDITKDVTERTQPVSDTVRRERAHVEDMTTDAGGNAVGDADRINTTRDNVNATDDDESLIDKAKDTVEGKNRRNRR